MKIAMLRDPRESCWIIWAEDGTEVGRFKEVEFVNAHGSFTIEGVRGYMVIHNKLKIDKSKSKATIYGDIKCSTTTHSSNT